MSCYTTKSCPSPFGEKQLTLLVIHSTECISDLIPRELLMNSGEERSLLPNTSEYLEVTVIFCVIGRTKTIIESSNVVTNDELCSEPHSENTLLVQEKTKEVEDSIPDDYVGKHNDEELLMLNDTVSVPSSSEPSTPIHETQQEQREPSPSLEQKGTSTSLVKGPSSKVKLNHPTTNILGSLNDNMRLRSKALNVITHSCYLSQFEPKKVDEALQDAD